MIPRRVATANVTRALSAAYGAVAPHVPLDAQTRVSQMGIEWVSKRPCRKKAIFPDRPDCAWVSNAACRLQRLRQLDCPSLPPILPDSRFGSGHAHRVKGQAV